MISQKAFPRSFSIEYFPPKTEKGWDKLRANTEAFNQLQPNFYSVTFGAGGSTQQGTYDAVKLIMDMGSEAAPHISCIGSSAETILQLLNRYQALGVKRLVVLRGDMPSGMGGAAGEFRHANELIEFIRAKTGDQFHIEVAAYPEFHPQSVSVRDDLANFKRKVESGANSAITQYFYNVDAYYRFADSCEKLGLHIPIVPGVMPITNYVQLVRFSTMCGAEIPQWIKKRLQDFEDDMDSLKAFGYDVTLKLCDDLLKSGAPGLHFYCLNQLEPTTTIWKALAL
jgi:methylenetetrahydrofolate reductase (NADPH)